MTANDELRKEEQLLPKSVMQFLLLNCDYWAPVSTYTAVLCGQLSGTLVHSIAWEVSVLLLLAKPVRGVLQCYCWLCLVKKDLTFCSFSFIDNSYAEKIT